MSEYTPTTEWAIVTLAEGVPLPTWDECEKVARDWLAQHDAEVAKAAKVEALREAADEWTQSAWAKDMAPGNDRPSLILGTSQRAANFLRAVADRIEAGEGA